MRTANLKLKMYTSNIDILEHVSSRTILHTILWSFGGLALLYVLLLANMVTNIIERRGLETEARALTSAVSELELTYLSLSNGIDLKLSQSLGFKETEVKFATRKSLSSVGSIGSVKIANNEI